VASVPDTEAREVQDLFRAYGLSPTESCSVVESLRKRPKDWVKFMMRFELGLEPPAAGRAVRSALTIAAAYAVGGFIPLSAYLLVRDSRRALRLSVAVTLLSLLTFGGIKSRFTGVQVDRGALQTAVVDGLAAASAFAIARWIG
jgi:VIT1/CCC1 family predicted Fe2+/Mn2+ transporter